MREGKKLNGFGCTWVAGKLVSSLQGLILWSAGKSFCCCWILPTDNSGLPWGWNRGGSQGRDQCCESCFCYLP